MPDAVEACEASVARLGFNFWCCEMRASQRHTRQSTTPSRSGTMRRSRRVSLSKCKTVKRVHLYKAQNGVNKEPDQASWSLEKSAWTRKRNGGRCPATVMIMGTWPTGESGRRRHGARSEEQVGPREYYARESMTPGPQIRGSAMFWKTNNAPRGAGV